MAQFARPASDITNSTWTTLPTDGQALYAQIDESSYSDTDYIRATGNGQTAEVKLSSVTDPVSSANHTLRLRAKATGSGGGEKWTVTVYQGATLIATAFSNTSVTRSAFNDYSYTLSASEANAISDYTDLRVRIVVSQGTGETIDVSWVELEVPAAATVTPMTLTGGSTPSGTVTKSIGQTKAGEVTMSGVLSRVLNLARTLTGAVGMSGDLTYQYQPGTAPTVITMTPWW